MKTLIVAAVTLDGFIAHGHHDKKIDWSSSQDKAFARRITTAAGVVIIGYHTFETLKRPLSNRQNIVLTHYPDKQKPQTRTIFTNDSPRKVLKTLAGQGFSEVVVYGGGQIYKLFLKAGLVDKMWLTITPHIFGQGIRFPYQEIHGKTKLCSSRPLGKGEILYEIDISE